jgi:probable F420-dependent oxidoreductase
MKIGFTYPQTELRGDPDAVRRIGRAVEDLGFSHLLAYDHVVGAPHDREPKLTGPYTDKDPFHDPFVMFAYLAGMTSRIEFVTGILILPQRQTVLVAKQAADLDLLSGQRFRMGVGTGWNYVEYDALGQTFADRGPRLTEQIGFLRRLWTGQVTTFKGKFDRIDRGNVIPAPKRPVPIWCGGFSEVAYRRAGKLGDGFIFARDPMQALVALERVKHHVKEAGRPLSSFGLELALSNTKNATETVDYLRKWQDAGGTHASFRSMGMGFTETQQHLDFMADIKQRLGR